MSKLNTKQKMACQFMVNNPEMQVQDVASKFDVDRTTIWRWQKKPEWAEYESSLCHEKFASLGKLAIEKLKQNATHNNQKAIEYILDYLGYKPVQKVEAELNTDISIEIDE